MFCNTKRGGPWCIPISNSRGNSLLASFMSGGSSTGSIENKNDKILVNILARAMGGKNMLYGVGTGPCPHPSCSWWSKTQWISKTSLGIRLLQHEAQRDRPLERRTSENTKPQMTIDVKWFQTQPQCVSTHQRWDLPALSLLRESLLHSESRSPRPDLKSVHVSSYLWSHTLKCWCAHVVQAIQHDVTRLKPQMVPFVALDYYNGASRQKVSQLWINISVCSCH